MGVVRGVVTPGPSVRFGVVLGGCLARGRGRARRCLLTLRLRVPVEGVEGVVILAVVTVGDGGCGCVHRVVVLPGVVHRAVRVDSASAFRRPAMRSTPPGLPWRASALRQSLAISAGRLGERVRARRVAILAWQAGRAARVWPGRALGWGVGGGWWGGGGG